MQNALSIRIAKLTNDLSQKKDAKQLKSELLDLAKDCQVLPEQNFLLCATARDMTPLVKRAFGPLSMIFPLTETRRRHVFLAVLAKLDADKRLDEMDDASRVTLLQRLLTLRNEDLITGAYGRNPRGYLRIVTRLGDVARASSFYLDLHRLLNDAPVLADPLIAVIGNDSLSDEMLEMLLALPQVPDAVKLADRFPDHGRLRSFLQTYQILTGKDYVQDAHMARIGNGESPDNIIADLYLTQLFAEARLQGHPDITYIKNGHELIATAKRFQNCLQNYVAEALRGERQFYIWRKSGVADLVFELKNDAPFGWLFSEVRHERNEQLTPELYEELRFLLCNMGITRCRSIEQLTQPFLYPFLPHDGNNMNDFDWLNLNGF